MKRPRPHVLAGSTYKVPTADGTLYVTLNEDEKGLAEVFILLGKSGSLTNSLTEALGRLISVALRSGVPREELGRQLRGIQRGEQRWQDGRLIASVPDAVGELLRDDTEEKGGEPST